jgi:PAS domain S-box-containing protein
MPGSGSQRETFIDISRTGGQSYRGLFELSPDPLIMHDGRTITLANPAMACLVGAGAVDDVIGRKLLDIVAPSSQAHVEDRIRHMHDAGPAPLVDETWRRADGSEVQVEVAATPMPWVGPRAAMVIARDVTERRRLEAERETLLAEKELLMREVHHRVSNSLHLIQGLLNLQARASESGEVRMQLSEASARIGTISILHGRLQKDGSATEGEVRAYIEGVMADLRLSLGETYRRPIVLETAAAPTLFLKADLLVALGLITAEAVTNSIKHGTGDIRVRLAKHDRSLELTIEDEGPGFPRGFDPARDGQGLGMRMIASLAQARGGTIIIGGGKADGPGRSSRIAAVLPL